MHDSVDPNAHTPERQSFLKLTRELVHLPLDKSAAALETSAAIAAISLRAAIEFLRAAPDAAEILDAKDLRSWGELGRRLAMSDVETSISFFTGGVGDLKELPSLLSLLFQLCLRQIALSAPVAVETLKQAPAIAAGIKDEKLLEQLFVVAMEIARRSVKHSAEFLQATPDVISKL